MTSALALKYADERSKRLRPQGHEQYTNVRADGFEDLGKDPWLDYDALNNQEAAIKDGDRIKFLIVGAGHSGLLFAHRLIQAGFNSDEIRLVDVAGGFGGTWYWNRYPGLMCDVESYVYLPLLEETGYVPTQKYVRGLEIRNHAERIAALDQVRGLFSTKVDSQEWDEHNNEWVVNMTQNRGPDLEDHAIGVRAQFVLNAAGIFPTPKIPIIPGFSQFRSQKRVFHTSRWDYNYTGGTEADPALVNLKDKVVGIIGTGATAIQVVPIVAKWAKHLYVFQRTPSYCGPRMNRATDQKTWPDISHGKNWQLERMRNFNSFISNDPAPVDLVNDGWTDHRAFAGVVGNPKRITPDNLDSHLSDMFKLDVARSNRVRARVDDEVNDPATAEKLKPWYQGWCKRPTFHDDYYQAFNQPNVTLVDTEGKGVEECTQSGIIANGVEYNLDTLILATGFTVNALPTAPSVRMDALVIGRHKTELQEKWVSKEYGSLFGIATNQFPNHFFYGHSGTVTSANLTSIFDMTAKLTAYIISEASRRATNPEKLVVEVTKEAEEGYTAKVKERALWYSGLQACTPGYFNGEGIAVTSKVDLARMAMYSPWGGGILDYERMTEEYKDSGTLEGFEISS
ncbi:hypothetical protein G7Z17_g1341 [Cylindrodendrum hubeiense]|uniref:Uncharacterized protein n=1 Tax=Cylindrodendrum hubeiense TaxID=595255 RepID=A0A9P5HF54_9HYPO|nr:hypothetical protein G7Z17_g1341 [Cylindrodendrum hubeiense]